MGLAFFAGSALLGAGLAMDAFSVSVADAVSNPGMKKSRMAVIAGTFAFFQFLMPVLGYLCVHTVLEYFRVFERFIPWIALILLLYIGIKMILEGISPRSGGEKGGETLTFGILFMQGIATSIDALSVGFTIAEYSVREAFVCAGIVAAVTFLICMTGLVLGKIIGGRAGERAKILGGLILIGIGISIFVSHL